MSWLDILDLLNWLVFVDRMLVVMMITIKLFVGLILVSGRCRDFFGVIVQDANGIETEQDQEENIGASEQPNKAINGILTAGPINCSAVKRYAEIVGGLFYISRKESEPNDIAQSQDEAQEIALVKGLASRMTVSFPKAENEAYG